jgi:hypothetical protein
MFYCSGERKRNHKRSWDSCTHLNQNSISTFFTNHPINQIDWKNYRSLGQSIWKIGLENSNVASNRISSQTYPSHQWS